MKTRRRHFAIPSLFATLVLFTRLDLGIAEVHPEDDCPRVFATPSTTASNSLPPLFIHPQVAAKFGDLQGPLEQVLSEWETFRNDDGINSPSTINIGLSEIPSKDEVEILGSVTNFPYDPYLYWPRHPFTEAPVNSTVPIPYLALPYSAEITALPTASRSLLMPGFENALFSIKLPTTHLTPNKPQGLKHDLIEEVAMAPWITDYLISIERSKKRPDTFFAIKDVASVIHKKSGNGYLIRDYTELKRTGNYYIPGSLLEKAPMSQLNQAVIPTILGTAYADLVLHTGIQFMTPHGQNVLLEITPQGRLTGRVFFRDWSDTYLCLEEVALLREMAQKLKEHLGEDSGYTELKGDARLWPNIVTFTSYVYGDELLRAYLRRIETVLALPITQKSLAKNAARIRLQEISRFLRTPEGQLSLKRAILD